MMAISMMAIAIVAITIVAITIVAITITSIVAVIVVVVPSATESVDEVVQSVANVVANICPCGGTSESTCRIKMNKTTKQISTTNRKEIASTCNTSDNLASILLANHVAKSTSH